MRKVRLATPVHDDDLFRLAYKLIVNDSLHPFPRTDNPADAASSVPASSSGSSYSYDGDDARRFFREWRAAEDRYSEAIWNNSQLEIHLGVLQAALNAAEEETNDVRARLAKSNTVVAGRMSFMNVSILVSVAFVLIFFYNCQLKWCNWNLFNRRRMRPWMPSMRGGPPLTLVSKTSRPASKRLLSMAFVMVRRWR